MAKITRIGWGDQCELAIDVLSPDLTRVRLSAIAETIPWKRALETTAAKCEAKSCVIATACRNWMFGRQWSIRLFARLLESQSRCIPIDLGHELLDVLRLPILIVDIEGVPVGIDQYDRYGHPEKSHRVLVANDVVKLGVDRVFRLLAEPMR